MKTTFDSTRSRRMRQRSVSVFAHAALVLTCSTVVAGNSDTPTAEEICTQRLRPGQHIELIGKYKELIDEQLHLFDCTLVFHVKSDEHFQALLNLTAKKDNLLIAGTVFPTDNILTVSVDRLEQGPDDYSILEARLQKITEQTSDDQRTRLYKLALRALKTRNREDDARLRSLAHEAFGITLGGGNDRLSCDEVRQRLALIRKMHRVVEDATFTRNLLVDLLKRTDNPQPVEDYLTEIDCRPHRDQWITYQEFKRLEGLVDYESKWISIRDQHHIATLRDFSVESNEALQLLRARTEEEYILLADEGDVEIGMLREEVALALGFPTYVLRLPRSGKEFDQWSYSKKYYYFFDGILVHVADVPK